MPLCAAGAGPYGNTGKHRSDPGPGPDPDRATGASNFSREAAVKPLPAKAGSSYLFFLAMISLTTFCATSAMVMPRFILVCCIRR